MEIKMSAIVICFVLVAQFVDLSDGLICYHCNGCSDPFKEDEATTGTCVGSCMKIKPEEGGVIRICAPYVQLDGCGEVSDAETCFCKSDKCNSATMTPVSIPAMLIIAGIITLMKLF